MFEILIAMQSIVINVIFYSCGVGKTCWTSANRDNLAT